MKVFGKVQKKKKKRKEKLNHSSWTCVQALLQRWPTPHVHISTTSLITSTRSCWQCHVLPTAMSKTASRTGTRSSSSSSVTKGVTASRLEAIAGPWYFFSKLAAHPSLKTPARRLLDVTVARRTCASKNIGKERGSAQVKSMLNALGKTDRCLVGVVLFARFECLRRNAPDPSRQRQGPRPPNRDVWVRNVRNSRPPFVKRSGSFDQTFCLWSSRSLSLSFSISSFLLFFFIFTFFRNGQGQKPPSPKRACLYFGKCGNLRTVPKDTPRNCGGRPTRVCAWVYCSDTTRKQFRFCTVLRKLSAIATPTVLTEQWSLPKDWTLHQTTACQVVSKQLCGSVWTVDLVPFESCTFFRKTIATERASTVDRC